jgi:Flp pilus assembly protein TadD
VAAAVTSPWRRPAQGIVAVFGIALALRALYAYQLHDSLLFTELFGDGQQYDAWAREVATGDWVGREVFYQAPLYPYFLALLYTLGGHDLLLVRAVQALLGSLSCALLAYAGTKLVSRRAGVCAGLLLAVYPPAIFFDGLIQKSSLDLFLTTLLLALIAAFLERQRLMLLAALGVALGALTLNRENARVVYLVVVPWLLLYFRGASILRRSAWGAIFLFASASVLLPVAWRNYRVGGEFLLSTSQLGPNLFIGNHPGANGLYAPLVSGRGDARAERADAVRLAEEASGRSLTPGEVSQYWIAQSFAYVASQPLDWLRLMAWKSFLTFNAIELADSESIDVFASRSWVLRGLRSVLGFGVLGPLAVLGIWATRRDWRRLAILYALILGFAASVALFYVFSRYRFPMVPFLACFAGAGLAAAPEIVRGLRDREGRRQWLPGVLLAVITLVPTNWPLPQYRDDEVTWYNLGVTLLERGRAEDAAQSLGEAVRIKPDFGLAHHQLGRTLAQQGKLDLAERELALAADLLPDLARAQLDHAILALRRDGWSEAGIRHLRRAAALSPGTAELHTQLARVLALRGDLSAALQELRIALQLAPDSVEAANDLAWILATHPDPRERNGAEAVALLEPLLATPSADTPEVLDALAAAYAEAGRFDDAVAMASRAAARARATGQAPIAAIIEARRALYQGGQPFHQSQRN